MVSCSCTFHIRIVHGLFKHVASLRGMPPLAFGFIFGMALEPDWFKKKGGVRASR